MEILDNASLGFIVIFIATLFIFGELMVKAKGIFAVIGVAIMAMYFSYHLTASQSLWIVILYFIGLALIIFDGKVTGDGTIAIIGLVLMILGLALPAPGITYKILVGMALIIAAPTSYLFTKVFPKRSLWSKLTLNEKLSSELGYNAMNESYKKLVGKSGVTKTPFRPTGTVEIDGEFYSATTDNQWLDAEVKVKVISVDGTKIVVVPE